MDSSRLWTAGILVVTVVVFGAILAANSGNKAPAPTTEVTEDQATILNVIDSDQVRGRRADAPVTLIEYGDFQCPGCATYEPQLQQLVSEYPDTLRFVFRHFPLPQHPQAELMARASEAAAKQGKFWEMHDLIYAKQTEWANKANAKEIAMGYARELNLDQGKFAQDLYADDVTDLISRGKGEAKALNAPGTPAFYLNGQPLENPRSYDAFKQAIEAAAAENQ